MFGPSSSLAHVCLRCQRRLARRAVGWRSVEKGRASKVPVRHQSTAAARIFDDEYGDHESGVQVTEAKDLEDEKSAENTNVFQSDPHRNRSSNIVYKKWHPSALLGMESLGRPAEVLLLSPRDRRIVQVPDAGDQERTENFYETLASEKQPLSWSQLKHNIEQAREGLQEDSPILQSDEYNKLYQRLRNGYTRSQLCKYYREAAAQNTKARNVLMDNASTPKKTVIECIAKELWGFILPHHLMTTKLVQKREPKQEEQRVRFPKHEGVYNMLFNQTKYRNLVRGIALAHGVEIDFVPEKLWIDIKGDKDGVGKARKEIVDLKVSFKNVTLHLPALVKSVFSKLPADQKQELIREVSSKYKTPINMDSSGKIEVTCSPNFNGIVKHLERELRLALEALPSLKDNFSIWASPEIVMGSQLIPVQPVSQLSWSSYRKYWSRLYASNRSVTYPAVAQLSNAQRQQYEDLSKQIAELTQPASPVQVSHSRRELGGLRNECSATFGTALVADHNQFTAIKKKRDIAKMPFFAFAPDLPVLPQYTTSLKPWGALDQSIPCKQPLLSGMVTRLVYRPLVPLNDLHHYEVYLINREQSDGSHQQLQVARVTAVYREKAHCLLLPDTTVDINFTQQLKQDLFLPIDSSPQISFPHVLQAIAGHASTVQNGPEDEVDPMVSLPAPKAIPWPEKSPQTKDKKTGVIETRQTQFLLSSVERVTSEAYQTPVRTRYALEHTGYDGGRWGPSREELRLSETQLFSTPREEKIRFHHFFNCAVDIAERLHNTAPLMLGVRNRA